MTDPSVIQATLSLGKSYYSDLINKLVVNLQTGSCVRIPQCENSYGALEYVLSALNYQVESNIYNGTTEVLYEQLVKIIGNYVPDVIYTQLAKPVLTINVISNTEIDLSWTDVANAASYKLERATNGTFTANLVTLLQADLLVYSDTGLTAATTYYYRLKAIAPVDTLYTDSEYATGNGTTDAAPLTTVYYGWKDTNAVLSDAEIISTTTTISITAGSANYILPFNDNQGIKFVWFAELSTEPLKTKWQDTVVEFNNGNIGTETDLFGAPTTVETRRFYQTEYATTFANPIQIKTI